MAYFTLLLCCANTRPEVFSLLLLLLVEVGRRKSHFHALTFRIFAVTWRKRLIKYRFSLLLLKIYAAAAGNIRYFIDLCPSEVEHKRLAAKYELENLSETHKHTEMKKINRWTREESIIVQLLLFFTLLKGAIKIERREYRPSVFIILHNDDDDSESVKTPKSQSRSKEANHANITYVNDLLFMEGKKELACVFWHRQYVEDARLRWTNTKMQMRFINVIFEREKEKKN